MNVINNITLESSDVNEINVLDINTEKDDCKTVIQNDGIFVINDNLVNEEFDIKEENILTYLNGDDDNTENVMVNYNKSNNVVTIDTLNIFKEIKTEKDCTNTSLQNSILVIDDRYSVKDKIDSIPYNTKSSSLSSINEENIFTKIEQMSPEGCNIFTENIFEIKTESDYKRNNIETTRDILKREHKVVNKRNIQKLKNVINKSYNITLKSSNVDEINLLDTYTEKGDIKTDIQNAIIDDNLVKEEIFIEEQILTYSNGDDDNEANHTENVFNKIKQMSPEGCDIFTENIIEIKTESDYERNNIETSRDVLIKHEHKDVNKHNITKLKSITNFDKEQDKRGICKQSFIHNGDLKNHIFTNNHKKNYICDICQKSYTLKTNLRCHIITHTYKILYKCKICEKSFTRKQNLNRHRLIHTGEKPHRCKICQKSFTRKSHLNGHMLTHTGEKPYTCEICYKSFARKTNLNNHKLTHNTGDKPNKCKLCQKSFTLKQSLNNHMLTHTGEKPYNCEICPKSFTRKSILNTHVLTHTGEKPYTCEICYKSFAHKTNLNNHKLAHTGDKPNKCKLCQKSFSLKQSLNNHMLTHTGERPYNCEICPKSFTRKSILNTHVLTHTGDKP